MECLHIFNDEEMMWLWQAYRAKIFPRISFDKQPKGKFSIIYFHFRFSFHSLHKHAIHTSSCFSSRSDLLCCKFIALIFKCQLNIYVFFFSSVFHRLMQQYFEQACEIIIHKLLSSVVEAIKQIYIMTCKGKFGLNI